MKKRQLSMAFSLFFAFVMNSQTIILSGKWQFATDPQDKGISEKWFTKPLAETINLPGTMADNGKGNLVSVDTKWIGDIIDKSYFNEDKYAKYRVAGNIKMPFWLNPELYYMGRAWYQREIEIPASWSKKRIELFLERCHWETTLWIDGKEVGMRNSLGTPNTFDVSNFLNVGKHTITISVDNRIKDINVGVNSHSVSDHTQGNWNGIVGKMELISSDNVYIENINVYPDVENKKAVVKIKIANKNKEKYSGSIEINVSELTGKKQTAQMPKTTVVLKNIDKDTIISIEHIFANAVLTWDEFNPNLYKLKANLVANKNTSNKDLTFGMRNFSTKGTRITINNRPIFLRGTLDCSIFPKTGHPPTEEKEWTRIFNICKSYGLNHIRFHSYTPPAVAFDAADKVGIYLLVECSSWANQGSTIGDGKPIDQYIYDESERVVAQYGNHPSFCMMAYGNEPAGDKQNEYLGKFVSYWKTKDQRRIYTGGAGWPDIPESDYMSSPNPRIQGWGEGLNSIINAKKPSTAYDFREKIKSYNRPVVSHEIGQWCVYPNFEEIKKYTGNLKAKNFEIFRDDLTEKGMGGLAHQFLLASGKLQTLCYRADIEAAMRTPGFAGFQLLGLQDFSGQGTALVGVVDAFWEDKGYVDAKEFSRFNAPVLALARMEKRTFLNSETFTASIEGVNFGKGELKDVKVSWKIVDQNNGILQKGVIPVKLLKLDNCQQLGDINYELTTVKTAQKLKLILDLAGHELDYDFWVYPSQKGTISGENNVKVVQNLDDTTIKFLEDGGTVLLTLKKGSLADDFGGNIKVGFSSIFWNTAWTSGQPPHTLGILCEPTHPALAEFPTEYHSNWQWWDAMSHSGAINLSRFSPKTTPIVRVIDDWFTNRSLALVFEGKVGKGKILISGIDFVTDLKDRPEAQQLLYSLKKYICSERFKPEEEVGVEVLKEMSKG